MRGTTGDAEIPLWQFSVERGRVGEAIASAILLRCTLQRTKRVTSLCDSKTLNVQERISKHERLELQIEKIPSVGSGLASASSFNAAGVGSCPLATECTGV
jgi:hypothetical protein